MGKFRAKVNITGCLACGGCVAICPQDNIVISSNKAKVNAEKCTGCSLCVYFCPLGAIKLVRKKNEV